MKKIVLISWLAWLILAAAYLGKYIRIRKRFAPEVANLQWKIWTTKNSKINIVFPNSTLENFFKKYLPGDYQPAPRHSRGKFLLLNGTNGWHHLTKKFIDEFYPEGNFTLILIDAHPDATPGIAESKINCGNWVNTVHQPVIFLGGSAGFDEEINRFLNPELLSCNRLRIYSARNFSFYLKSPKKISAKSFRKIRPDRLAALFGSPGYYIQTYSLKDFYRAKHSRQKVYITIDLDVLNSRSIETTFGSGILEQKELLELLDFLARNYEIIGADICGITPASSEKALKTWQLTFTRILRHLNI